MITEKGHAIGERVGTKQMTQIIDDQLVTSFYARIEVDGKMIFVRSNGELVKASTRKEARQLAVEVRDRVLRGGSGE
jgi:uncharacterized lipoprotein YbaY